MKHSAARNCIEWCFGILKLWWAILWNEPYFPARTQGRIIVACCLLHNLMKREMSVDPVEAELDELKEAQGNQDGVLGEVYIDVVKPSDQWTDWRVALAT
ncbi:hypothetical protein Acr_24g0005450 [Actinidia rufa]|uniref:Nuclease HARBI1 n=1 Tax=Actinidia rufa TaxID=165716 RepID=A0A7J0GU37_9ERIC|nr:hypothetical protein Acr_24g0005450 [Actinidia rufa]